MKGEKEDKKDGQQSYSFKKCNQCGIKLHIHAQSCWKCGKYTENHDYFSNNPDDSLYSKGLNYVEKCMNCYNVNYLGKEPCPYISCFAKGKGNCEACRITHSEIFDCCQETMKTEPPPTEEDFQKLKAMLGGIGKTKPAPKQAAPAEFEDDIPF